MTDPRSTRHWRPMLILAGVLAGMAAEAQPDPDPDPPAAAPADSPAALTITARVEAEVRTPPAGREARALQPADRVVPGDPVIYTLEVRNTGATPAHLPTIVYPVPRHMRYLANSAVGPGAVVTYSVDGGRSFDRPDRLEVSAGDDRRRPALAADYTHIRWQLRNTLKVNSVAFVRFRAVVK